MLGRKLMVVHGWSASKYCADKHLQMAKPYSVIYHHSHRAEQRTTSMADGRLVTALNAGCLCLKQPVYALSGMPTEWTTGFWVCYMGRNSFSLYSIPILGKGSKRFCIMPDGKEIKS